MSNNNRKTNQQLTRAPSEERVDTDKLKTVLAEASGVKVADIGFFRKPLPIEIMFTQALKLGVKKFGLEVGGKFPKLADLLNPNHNLTGKMWKYNHRVRKSENMPVAIDAEIKAQMASLYNDKVTDAEGEGVVYTVCVPLLNHETSTARAVIEEAVASLHTVIRGAKPINCKIRWVGMTEQQIAQEPLEPKTEAATPASPAVPADIPPVV